jgi:alkanesulfonate monooxygenase
MRNQPPEPHPRIYFGGSSAPALALAARHADTYLTWGEPVRDVAEKVARVREMAEAQGGSWQPTASAPPVCSAPDRAP